MKSLHPSTLPTVLPSTSRALIGAGLQSLSVADPGVLVEPLRPSVKTGKGRKPTRSSSRSSKPISTVDLKTYAEFAQASLQQLVLAGLCRLVKVLATDGSVKEYRVVFDPGRWTEDLTLRSVGSE